MRYLFLLIFLTTNTFSQNYHYAVDKASEKAAPDTTAPSRPTNLVADNITQNSATLNWTAATDDVGVVDYRVYNNNDLFLQSTGGPVTTFTLTNLILATNYSLTIRAVDAAGNESINSNTQTVTVTDPASSITRFIMIGASVVKNSFVPSSTLKLINTAYPSHRVEFYNEAVNGATSTAMTGLIDGILAKYANTPGTTTYVFVKIGGNDVTRNRPYATVSSQEKAKMTNNISTILDAIEAKGFIPILNMIGFRDYDDTTYSNEENGVLPYNENIIKPLILSRTPNFAYEDGTSFFQAYELLYNNYETYLHEDNVHPTGSGEGALRNHFVNTICKYIFEGKTPTKIVKNSKAILTSNNLQGEIDALEDAYYLPISQKANLQSALNTYKSVRLDKGDYSGAAITMSGNMKLYGHPSITKVPAITLNSCDGLVMESITPNGITIPSGQVIRNSKFISIAETYIQSVGGIIENNTFIDMSRTRFNWDMSNSGYIRNNKIIRYWVQAYSDQLILKGNNATPSYGNSMVFSQFLTPGGNTMEINNLQDFRMAGLDAETWNFSNKGTRAALYMRKMGNVKIAVPSGGHNGTYKTPVFDIEANNLFMIGKKMNQSPGYPSIARANTNVFMVKSNNDPYNLESGTGFDFRAFFNNNNVIFNTISNIVSLITGDTNVKLTNMILDEKLKPWARPNFETLPNPSGANWQSNRTGKADQRAYIQGLIDSNGIAELDEGIYYISGTLNISNGQGIVGKGTGKTVIVGLTDDFDLVTMKGTNTRSFTLAHMTLQGGRAGLRILPLTSTYYQPNACRLKYLVFRNQTHGIHVGRIFGLDNNFLDHVSFVDCVNGFFLDSDPNYTGGETTTMTYYDKVVFYQSQFINNDIGVKAYSKRASNLNAWIDSKFENNRIAADLTNHNYPFFANCDFSGHTGSYVVKAYSHPAFYSCNFSGNSTTRIIDSNSPYIEGSNLLDNIPVFTSNSTEGYILNSTFRGDIGGFKQGMIINSNMQSNPSLNKLMVKIDSGLPTTLLDATPTPYPQLLVTH